MDKSTQKLIVFSVSFIIKKFDCNRIKTDLCYNGGICSADGSCICTKGYNGSSCSTC